MSLPDLTKEVHTRRRLELGYTIAGNQSGSEDMHIRSSVIPGAWPTSLAFCGNQLGIGALANSIDSA